MTTLRALLSLGTSRLRATASALDVRDVLLFGGLTMLGHGLYLLRPWLAFSVCGAVLMALACLMRERR